MAILHLAPQPAAPSTAPNYRAFCIAMLELRGTATPELVAALAVRYRLLLDALDGGKIENPLL